MCVCALAYTLFVGTIGAYETPSKKVLLLLLCQILFFSRLTVDQGILILMSGKGRDADCRLASETSWGALRLDARATPATNDNNAPPVIVFDAERSHITIGRRPGSDVVIVNPCVSATHCIIARCVAGTAASAAAAPAATAARRTPCVRFDFTLADFSTNGCYINGTLVGKGNVAHLKPGDEVELVRAAPDRADRYNMKFLFEGLELLQIHEPESTDAAKNNTALVEENAAPRDDGGDARAESPEAASEMVVEAGVGGAELADDVAVGAPAVASKTTDNEDSQCEDANANTVDALLQTRESSVEHLRRRHQSDVESFYTLNKDKPLGVGSFATVYEARMIPACDANQHPAVLSHFRKVLFTASEAESSSKQAVASTDDDSVLFDLLCQRRFAVKVIRKSRILLPAADSQTDNGTQEDTTDEQRCILRLLLGIDEQGNVAALDAAGGTSAPTSVERKLMYTKLTPANRKLVEKELKNRQRQQREIDILTAVHHPNIVSLYELFETPSTLCFVMELCDGGELFPFVQTCGAIPEFFVKLIVFQVLKGVQYLHQVGIAHRDLKLENVLLSKPCSLPTLCQVQRDTALLTYQNGRQQKRDRVGVGLPAASCMPSAAHRSTGVGLPPSNNVPLREYYHSTVVASPMWWPQVKISDFGLSRTMETKHSASGGGGFSALMSTMCGTPLYAAPEVTITSLRAAAAGYTEAVDLFSIGVLCFALLCGKPPFPTMRDAFGRPQKGRLDYLAPLTWERKQVEQPGPRAKEGGEVDIAEVPYVPISQAGKDFTARLLKMRPSDRMTAAEALRHPWLRDCVELAQS